MSNSILLKRGLIVSPVKPGVSDQNGKKEGFKRADIRITDGVITEIGEGLADQSGEKIIDVNDLWITPGFIDIHTHLRDMNQSGKESIATGTKAAAAGGYTTVCAMANTDPTTDCPQVLSIVQEKIQKDAIVRVLPVVAVTKGLKGEELTEMVKLSEMGAIAFSDDGMPLWNLGLLKRALEVTKMLGKTIISHPEDHGLSQKGCINDSHVSAKMGLEGIPNVSESACVARELELVRATGSTMHFAHLSTTAAVALIRHAKAEGLPITAEVSPHHLSLCDDDIQNFDTRFKMNPPLRSKRDQNTLVEALKDGIFDAIATDHAPHTKQEKAQSFNAAPFGIIGLETAFSVVYERLVLTMVLSINELIYLLTTGPAQVIGLPDPALKPGARADITIIAPGKEWTYKAGKGFSRSSNSPYDGKTMNGKIIATICNGNIVYQEQQLVVTT